MKKRFYGLSRTHKAHRYNASKRDSLAIPGALIFSLVVAVLLRSSLHSLPQPLLLTLVLICGIQSSAL